jgi:hypothetical protein
VDWTVQRARLVEPVHTLGAGRRIAPVWPDVPGLALASNAQIYPRLLNGDSVVGFAERVAAGAAARLRLEATRGQAAAAAPAELRPAPAAPTR